jgi:hypothetical protein
VLVPTCFPAARWRSGPTPESAVASWDIGAYHEEVELDLDGEDRLRRVVIQRWGNPDGMSFGRYEFGVTFDEEHRFGGVTIPTSIRAGWGESEFFHAQIVEARFR